MNSMYHHQHIVTLLSGKPIASELLLRQHCGASLFDMLKEPSRLVSDLVSLTQSKVAHAKRLLDTAGCKTLFVNFAPCQVESPLFFHALDILDEILDRGVIVVLEVTENSLYESISALAHNARVAKDRGYLLAIDDFGSGESNFNALFELQPSIVKLDGHIVSQATVNSAARDGFFHLTELLRNLDFKVVIEGVETNKELLVARHANADFAQGYLFHKPEGIPVDKVMVNTQDVDDRLNVTVLPV